MTNKPMVAIAVLGSSLVMGCAWMPWNSDADAQQRSDMRTLKVVPHARIQDGGDSAAAFHALGRHLQREGRLEDAERAYRRALDFDPAHQETRNALAALYASRGDLVQAISLLSALVVTHPDQPHLLANLGYAHYLNGDYPAAKEELQQALAMAPDNEATQHKLALVKEKLGEPADDLPAMPQPVSQRAANQPVQPAGDVADTRNAVVRISEGVYALTRTAAAGTLKPYAAQCDAPVLKTAQGVPAAGTLATPSSAASSASSSASSSAQPASDSRLRLRIELANGNGINRLARTVRDLIAPQWQVVRVINHDEFSVPATRIEYARHRYEAARELADTLGLDAQLRPNFQQGDTQLRVVLGRDFRSADGLRERLALTSPPALASLD